MRRNPLAIVLLLTPLLGLGCDTATELLGRVAEGAGSAITAERPEGWESIDDEASAMRLYYQFVDARRQVRFVERLEDVPEARRASVGFVKMDVPPPLTPGDAARVRAARLAANGSVAPTPSSSARIVLYSAEWCGACRKAKRYLDRNGIAFEERDIDVPGHAEALVRSTGARAIPVLDVEGRMLTGFSESSYDAILREV